MAYLETTRTQLQRPRIWDAIISRMGNGVRAMQYGRMVQALECLSDEQLCAIELKRDDIPARARDAIYGA